MQKVKPVITDKNNTLHPEGTVVGYIHECPGCKMPHYINTKSANHLGAMWQFNGDIESPTFTPSVKILHGPDNPAARCHYFIANGQIQYCGDCIHSLAGQTVPLPDVD